MSAGVKLIDFVCGVCLHHDRFPVPDRAAMRETPQTRYADDPITIPVCARCEKVLGAPPAMFPRPATSDGRLSAFAVEYQARWTDWLSMGCPVGREPFRIRRVTPRFAV